MPKKVDITGQTFNDLTAIEICGKDGEGRFLWRCQCQCGREKITTSQKLKSSNTKSCGMCRNSTLPIDHTGKEIKGFRVVENIGKTEDNRLLWKCECIDCGSEKELTSKQIQTENVRPCLQCTYGFMVGQTYGDLTVKEIGYKSKKGNGCLCDCSCGNKDLIIDCANILRGCNRSCGCKVLVHEDITDKKYNRLTPIENLGKQKGQLYYLCKCDCGNDTIVSVFALRKGKTKSCGCLRKELMSKIASSKIGDKNNRWRGGIAIYNDMRKTKEYTYWKEAVKYRDNNTCQVCGNEEDIQCHHLNSVTGFPEQIFDPNNGICLCKFCHDTFHCCNDYGNNTREQFNAFLQSLGLQPLEPT